MPDDDLKLRAARARVGQVLHDRWRLLRLLGVGGMGAVYEATGTSGERVAIKILHADLAALADARERFRREGYAASRLEHPGAVRVLEERSGDDELVYLVMELLEGDTVERRRLRLGGKFPLEEALIIADRTLDVLAAAHSKAIIHRDIKPENLFITAEGALKVLDFGIARLREGPQSQHATRTGSAMGTPAFMPPEQALGQWDRVSERTDVWAVGATLFKLLSGRDPHEAPTVNQLLLAIMTKPVVPLASVSPKTPSKIAKVVDKALAFDPKKRFATATAMRAALRKAYESTAKRRFDLLPGLSLGPVSPDTPTLPTTNAKPPPNVPTITSAQTERAISMPAASRAQSRAAQRERRVRAAVTGAIASVLAMLAATGAAFGVRTYVARGHVQRALGAASARARDEAARTQPPSAEAGTAAPAASVIASASAPPQEAASSQISSTEPRADGPDAAAAATAPEPTASAIASAQPGATTAPQATVSAMATPPSPAPVPTAPPPAVQPRPMSKPPPPDASSSPAIPREKQRL